MRLIQDLQAEHELIETVVGSLRTFVAARLAGGADAADGPRFIEFFRLYAGDFHHAREEDSLFVALLERAQLPEAGPIATLRGDHHRMAELLTAMEAVIGLALLEGDTAATLDRLAREYSASLWHHIDAENSVLFPEAEARLRKQGLPELPTREMTASERAAMTTGRDLVARYTPVEDLSIIRGDGCVCCPALVEGCRGLEQEWWNEWEWEEMHDHLGEG